MGKDVPANTTKAGLKNKAEELLNTTTSAKQDITSNTTSAGRDQSGSTTKAG